MWIAPIKDSPKPPPSRITMTFPVLNRAKHAAFAACGQGKAAMVQVGKVKHTAGSHTFQNSIWIFA